MGFCHLQLLTCWELGLLLPGLQALSFKFRFGKLGPLGEGLPAGWGGVDAEGSGSVWGMDFGAQLPGACGWHPQSGGSTHEDKNNGDPRLLGLGALWALWAPPCPCCCWLGLCPGREVAQQELFGLSQVTSGPGLCELGWVTCPL